jgi:hypothetical protein
MTGKPSTGPRRPGDRTSEGREVRVTREATTVLDVLRGRGRRGLPLERLYRQAGRVRAAHATASARTSRPTWNLMRPALPRLPLARYPAGPTEPVVLFAVFFLIAIGFSQESPPDPLNPEATARPTMSGRVVCRSQRRCVRGCVPADVPAEVPPAFAPGSSVVRARSRLPLPPRRATR